MSETVKGIFRQQVLEEQRAHWLGEISLAQPLRLRVLAVTTVAAALAVACFLLLATYTRRSTVEGQLVPSKGLAVVLSPATGVLGRTSGGEGAHVSRGQRLTVVASQYSTPGSGDTPAALQMHISDRREGLASERQAQHVEMAIQLDGLRVQLASARDECMGVQAEIATRERQVQIAHEALQTMQRLRSDNYVSDVQLKQAESSVLDQISAVQALKRQGSNCRRTVAELEVAIRQLPSQGAVADSRHRRDLATLEQEKIETEARETRTVEAPVDGVIAAQFAKPGQSVRVGQPLFSVPSSDDALEAELRVPSRAIGFVAPGDTVVVRYQAWPTPIRNSVTT